MIELGMLFNRCLPIETLLRMPRKFVNRLREIRKMQKEQEAKQNMQMMNTSNAESVNHAKQVFHGAAIDDLVDELS